MPRLMGYRERSFHDAYCGQKIDQTRQWRAFYSGGNVGDLMYTNMQQVGQFAGDQTFVVGAIRVRSNVSRMPWSAGVKEAFRDAFLQGDDDRALGMVMDARQADQTEVAKAFTEWLHTTTAIFEIGQRLVFESSLFDLCDSNRVANRVARERDGETWGTAIGRKITPAVIPVRQNFYVNIQVNSGEAHQNLLAALEKHPVAPHPILWVHLEGLLTRDVA